MSARPETLPTPTLTPAGDPAAVVLAAVDGYRRHLTRRTLWTRWLLAAPVVALAPLLVVIADHVWSGGLPRPLLTGVLAVWAAGLIGALLITPLVSLARRLNPVFVARQLERVRRIRHNSLVNALLLFHSTDAAYAEEAVLRQAARDVTMSPPSDAAEPTRDLRPWIALLATVAAWLLYLVASPKPVGPSLARFFGADLLAPTATRLELVRPGPGEVAHAGQPLEIEFAVYGHPVTEIRFQILDSTAATDAPVREYVSSERAGREPDRRQFVLAPFEVQADIHFRCTAGDARLTGVIPVQPQPDVEHLEIALEPPAYTGLSAETVTDPDLRVLAGTRATFRLRANTPVREPVLVFRAQRETRTRMSVFENAPRTATLALILTESGTYRIHFSDPWGYAYRDPPEHRIEVRGDKPPTVEIVVPTAEETPDDVADVTHIPELVATAEDDVAVAELAFVIERDGVASRTVLVNGAAAQAHVTCRVSTADVPLDPGQSVQAWFEAADGRVLPDGRPAPQVGKSRVLTLLRPAPKRGNEPAQQSVNKPQTQPADGTEEQAGDNEQPSGDQGQPQGNEPSPDENVRRDGQNGDATTQASPADEGPEGELEGFVQKHGKDAGEVVKRLREKDQAEGGPAQNGGAQNPAGQAGGERANEREREQNGASQGGSPASQPSASQTQPARDSAQGSSGSSGRENPPEKEPGAANGPSGETSEQSKPGTATQPADGSRGQREHVDAPASQPSGQKPEQPPGDAGAPSGQRQGDTGQQPQAGDAGPTGESSRGTSGEGAGTNGKTGGQDARGPTSRDSADNSGQAAREPGGTGGSDAGKEQSGGGGKSEVKGSDGKSDKSNGQQAGQGAGAGGTGEGESANGATGGENREPKEEDAAGQSGGGGAGEGGEGPQLPEKPPELDPLNPPSEPAGADAPAEPLDSTGLAATFDLLELLARGKNVTEDLLVDMGWPAEKAAAFVKALQRLHENVGAAVDLDRVRRQFFDTRVGQAETQRGRGLSGNVGREIDPAEATRDGLRRIAPPPEQRVPERLQAYLDAYYRSLAAHRAREER